MWRVSASFEINLHTIDNNILKNFQEFFQAGSIYNRTDRPISVFRVTNISNIIELIIPHFDKYSLLTQKYSDYLLWKEVVILISKKKHINNLTKIINIYASINRGTSKLVLASFPNIKPVTKTIPILPQTLNPWWVSGFTAGDGGFFIGIRPKTNQIYFRFSITQHSKDADLIKLFISFFNAGNIHIRKNSQRCDYYIQDYKQIKTIIIKHFDLYPLYNIKTKDFYLFKQALELFILDKKNNWIQIQNIKNFLNSKN